MSDLEDILGIDGLDLDSKDATAGRYVLVPREEGSVDFHLLSIRQVTGHKMGKSIVVKGRALAATIEGVEVGEEYDLLFPFTDKTKTNYSNIGLRELMVACFGGDVKDVKSNKVNSRLANCIKQGEDLADGDLVFRLLNVGKPAVDKNDQPILNDDGKQRRYVNPTYTKSKLTVE